MSDGRLLDALGLTGGLAGETARLLDDVRALVARYVHAPEPALDVAAAWTLHTHAIGAASTTPYLHVTGPTMRCGKSRLMETLALVCARPLVAATATPAAIFRSLDADPPPTLLHDECDAIFRRGRNAADSAEDLRALLNAGHRRGTPALRCVGQGTAQTVKQFSTFGPKVLAGIGDLPATLADRSLRIRMERLTAGERVGRLLAGRPPEEAIELRDRLAAWAAVAVELLEHAEPAILDALDDRAADACLPLLAIGELAGEPWTSRLRASLVMLRAGDDAEPDTGARLLAAIDRAFETAGRPETMATADLLARLHDDEDAPGGYDPADAHGSGRRLAQQLRPYRVRPKTIRGSGRVAKGYRWDDLEPVLARYGAANGYIGDNLHGYADSEPSDSVTDGRGVTDSDEAQTRMDSGMQPMQPIHASDGSAGALRISDAGYEQFIRRAHDTGHLTARERDERLAVHHLIARGRA